MSVQLVLLVVGALVAVRLFLNWRKLSFAPGPFLASISDLWRAYYQCNGLLRGKLLQLHKEHGPIVRYGVNSISISDPGAISIIYRSRAGFITADSYKVLVGISNGKEVTSLVSTSDEAKHGALRRSVAKAFTPTAALDYEAHVDKTIPELIEALEKRHTVDMAEMLLFYSMDAASRLLFSEPLGCLRTQSDVGGTIELIRNRFCHWGYWSSLPDLERLVFRNPLSMRAKRTPSSMAANAVSKLQTRTSKGGEQEHVDLLQRFLGAHEESPDVIDKAGVVGLLMSTISGAGDTTATTMAALIYNVLRHPSVEDKLVQELKEGQLSQLPSFSEVNKLPYLNAVIKESMRVFPTPTWPMERKVPSGGVEISGTFFPEGTSVGCMPSAVHFNPKAFGEDAEGFRPERWLETNAQTLRAMEAAHLGFSRGRRVCLGQHIAVMQMKKVVAAIFMNFQMCLSKPGAALGTEMSAAVAVLGPLGIYVKRINR